MAKRIWSKAIWGCASSPSCTKTSSVRRSLPNNRLIAYKKRTGPDLAPWTIYVLDLSTMTERAIAAEKRSVDDQLEWLDEAHVLYGMRRSSQSALSDVWVAPIDGSEPARVFLAEGDSPTVIK